MTRRPPGPSGQPPGRVGSQRAGVPARMLSLALWSGSWGKLPAQSHSPLLQAPFSREEFSVVTPLN